MTERKSYPSDLTDTQWLLLEPLVPKAKSGGRPATYERREIVNAILYVLRTGASWRQLPHDLPPWLLVYLYFRAWRHDGIWDRIHNKLRDDLRVAEGRHRQPSAAILDSQSVKTTEKGGSTDTTQPRKSMGASDISWSTPWDC